MSLPFVTLSVFGFFLKFCFFSTADRANDSGLLTHKETLPVRSLVLGDVQRPGSESSYEVGPLRCHGDSKSHPELSMSPCIFFKKSQN